MGSRLWQRQRRVGSCAAELAAVVCRYAFNV